MIGWISKLCKEAKQKNGWDNELPTIVAEPTLRHFYMAYANWLLDGAPDGKPFDRGKGLCSSVEDFVENKLGTSRDLAQEISIAMGNQFKGAGLDFNYPFSDKNDRWVNPSSQYQTEYVSKSIHLNPHRIMWVFRHAFR